MYDNKKNIFEDINFTTLTSQFSALLTEAIENFWEQEDVKVSLCAINDFKKIRDEFLVANIDFFSSQIRVENHNPVIIRLSKDFIKYFFHFTLKSKTKVFKLGSMTALEIKILNSFCEFVYKKFKDILIPQKDTKLSEKSDTYINFVFFTSIKDERFSKIVVSIPSDRLNFAKIKKKISFKDEDFLTSNSIVKIRAGSTKITLEELQNLAIDDIVVLEDSDTSKLTLVSGELEKKFNVKVKSSLIFNLDDETDDETQTYNEVIMEKNLWDDIQIELSAEFEKVKMTIGELKQITQGQIVDLGSVFDSEISLFVENKKVAKGELMIINDRYAVRLNEVLSNAAEEKIPQSQQSIVPPPAPAAKPAQAQTAKAQARPQQQQQAAAPKAAANPKPAQAAKPATAQQAAQPQAKPQAAEDEEFDYSDFEK